MFPSQARSLSRIAAVLLTAFTASLSAQIVQADYPLQTDLLDTTGTYGPVTLTGTPPPAMPTPGNGVCHNGTYAGNGGQEIRTATVTSLDSTDFQIDVDFNLTSVGANRPILMGGNGWRWIGLYVDAAGQLGVLYNNANYKWSTTTVTPGTWYSASIRFDSGFVELYLNGSLILFEQLGVLNTNNDFDFMTNNWSNGQAFDGCIMNLTISNDATLVSSIPPQIVGVVETVPLSGTMNEIGGTFAGGDFIRWNYNDDYGTFPGAPALSVVNYGYGGPPPVGVTALIPGFDQLSAASTPSGLAIILGPNVIGGPDVLIFVPPGLLGVGDSLRVQGLVLDLTPGLALPITPTRNTVLFAQGQTCLIQESFESTPLGTASYPTGWSSGGGTQEWTADDNGTTSGNTGPTGGSLFGTVYMYCETSSPTVLGDTYIMNTDTYSLAGATTVGFSLSRVGATIDTLEVRMDDGSGTYPMLLATYTGPEPGGAEWTQEALTIPAGAPASASFQFHYTRGTSFTGDLAIDNFCIN